MGDKFRELILYVCRRSEGDANFGLTKLNKLLWFTDMAAFLSRGASVTGRNYIKLPYGPVPSEYEETIRDMQKKRQLAVRVENFFGYPQKRLLALVEPNLDAFTADEIALVDAFIHQYWNYNGSDMSHLSHEHLGWQLADLGEPIPFEVGFVEQPQLTIEERAYAHQLTELPEYISCHAN